VEAITPALIAVGAVNLLLFPLLLFLAKRSIGRRLDAFDEKRNLARVAQSEAEKKAIEQREAERAIVLAIARTMLLDNYEKCMAKGFYSIEERAVYGNLFRQYQFDGGNGVIEEIAPRIRALPTDPPNDD
jgi:hypothetical protein